MARPSGNLHEQGFNYALARTLRETTAHWREHEHYVICERSGSSGGRARRPDIVIQNPRMPEVVIECAYGGDRDRDAQARLTEEGETGPRFGTAIAVAIPEAFRSMSETEAENALRNGASIGFALLQEKFRFPKAGYILGPVPRLAAMVLAAAVPQSHIEEFAERVAALIDEAAQSLRADLPENRWEKIAKAVHQRSPLNAFRTVLVLWLDAMVVQAHLHEQGRDDIPYLSPEQIYPVKLVQAWKQILTINWYAIFAPAVQVLEVAATQARSSTVDALQKLHEALDIMTQKRLGNYVSIGAELFPKLSDDQKSLAAFYTRPATAELLAALTIHRQDREDWGDHDVTRRIRVADLACGTGTLLRSAYRRIQILHENAGGDADSLITLHKNALEEGLQGTDVNPIAAHLTNSSLAVVGGGEPYGQTHIGWVDAGKPAARGPGLTTGSLEFLETFSVEDLLTKLGSSASGAGQGEPTISVPDRSLDYLLMNPPYSRTRGGQSAFDIAGLSKKERVNCQKRWKYLLRGEPANKIAGMAASFLCLANKKIRAGGRLGFVLPLTAAFSPEWAVTRKMIATDFTDILAISKAGASAGDDALSADTGMGEMLLVAKKKPKTSATAPAPIYCITLREQPLRQGEAGEYARSISEALEVLRKGTADAKNDSERWINSNWIRAGKQELGQIIEFYADAGEPWSPLGALHPDLVAIAVCMVREGVLANMAVLQTSDSDRSSQTTQDDSPKADNKPDMRLPVPMIALEDVFDVGPTHHLIGHIEGNQPIGAFTWTEITRKADAWGKWRALWNADAKTQQSLIVAPTHKGRPYDPVAARNMAKLQGHLHYARGMRWTSQALLAATTQHPCFGGRAWATLIHDDPRVSKAFALWANSLLGLLVHWTQASRTQKGRAPTQIDAIRSMPCPDLPRLNAATLDRAASDFDRLSEQILKPACQAHVDEVRKKIDEAVINMMSLPQPQATETLDALRDAWCAEPTVHGDNRSAIGLLRERDLLDCLVGVHGTEK